MHEFSVRFSKIEDIRKFVEAVLSFDYEIDLSSGRYLVDAKSIMGIFSLDLMHPIRVIAHTDNATALKERIKDFIVE